MIDGMNLASWTDLDLAYLLIFGEHPDLHEPVSTPEDALPS